VGGRYYLLFPRGDDRARVYLLWDKDQPQRFAGPAGPAKVLDQMRAMSCFPADDIFDKARAVSGCASYPMEDAWTDRPYTPGVVLIGDAAGWNDPIIGQGLSIAVRDVRLVAAALLRSPDWSPSAFQEYAAERTERMRRLRADSRDHDQAPVRFHC
jgi:2-polyprenyl-6-methoxyphenol hydroxylase-like FAD-dependent oxidoreductase